MIQCLLLIYILIHDLSIHPKPSTIPNQYNIQAFPNLKALSHKPPPIQHLNTHPITNPPLSHIHIHSNILHSLNTPIIKHSKHASLTTLIDYIHHIEHTRTIITVPIYNSVIDNTYLYQLVLHQVILRT